MGVHVSVLNDENSKGDVKGAHTTVSSSPAIEHMQMSARTPHTCCLRSGQQRRGPRGSAAARERHVHQSALHSDTQTPITHPHSCSQCLVDSHTNLTHTLCRQTTSASRRSRASSASKWPVSTTTLKPYRRKNLLHINTESKFHIRTRVARVLVLCAQVAPNGVLLEEQFARGMSECFLLGGTRFALVVYTCETALRVACALSELILMPLEC